jgi:hypothetical protein
MFKKILEQVESEQDKKECRLILTLVNAWKAMAHAEAESSPERYAEAAALFEEAKDISLGERGKLLALGHSRFCKALEVGVRFSDTGDLALHTLVNQNLESAANYYTKAGLTSASEYAKASKLMFEGYVHLTKANMETDHTRKTKLYAMAEKLLEASADSLEKAGQPGKIDQVRNLLRRTREEKELAVSLTELLQAPDVLSSTIAFSTPTPTFEKAVGVERFEGANLQASCTPSKWDLRVGEELELEFEITNAGRATAELTKLDGVVPEGFEVLKKPERCRLEDSSLIVKGRKVPPVDTANLTVIIKATEKGSFRLKPVVIYTDETGTSRSSATEELPLTVRELGISGWLKGPERPDRQKRA